jgi:hypothetical protein
MHGKLHDDFGYVEGGELVLEAPYRNIQLRVGIYSRNLLSPLSLAQRVLTRFGSLAKRRKLAQAVLMRPGSPSRAYISRIIVPSSSKNPTLIQVAKAGETLYLLILQPQRPDDARREKRQLYCGVALLKLRPRQYDDESYIGDELTSRL